MRLSVVYATRESVWEGLVEAHAGATLREVLAASGVRDAFPELRDETLSAGIFGRLHSLDDVVHDGDRVEIYRPLQVDPKEARRIRADLRRRAGQRRTGG